MPALFAIIPTRSERQAMDWSLVLVSQGIDATIEHNDLEKTWQLVVNAPDYPRALQAIHQYRAENRRPLWRQELPWTGLIFDWRSVFPLLFLALVFALEAAHPGKDQGQEKQRENAAPVEDQAGQW